MRDVTYRSLVTVAVSMLILLAEGIHTLPNYITLRTLHTRVAYVTSIFRIHKIHTLHTLYTVNKHSHFMGRDSSDGIVTRYGLDGPGIESQCGRDFLNLSRLALWPTQPPIQWVPGLSRG